MAVPPLCKLQFDLVLISIILSLFSLTATFERLTADRLDCFIMTALVLLYAFLALAKSSEIFIYQFSHSLKPHDKLIRCVCYFDLFCFTNVTEQANLISSARPAEVVRKSQSSLSTPPIVQLLSRGRWKFSFSANVNLPLNASVCSAMGILVLRPATRHVRLSKCSKWPCIPNSLRRECATYLFLTAVVFSAKC